MNASFLRQSAISYILRRNIDRATTMRTVFSMMVIMVCFTLGSRGEVAIYFSPAAMESLVGGWQPVLDIPNIFDMVDSVAMMSNFISPRESGEVSSSMENPIVDEAHEENWEKIIADNSTVLVFFYAPWSRISHFTSPQFDRAASLLLHHKPPIKSVRVDGSALEELADRYQVTTYPSIVLITEHGYDSAFLPNVWTTNQIVNSVNEVLDRDHIVYSIEDLEKFIAHSKLNVIGLFNDESDRRAFQKISRHQNDILFCETNVAEIQQKFLHEHNLSKTKIPTLIFLKPWDEHVVAFEGNIADPHEIEQFVRRNKLPYFHAFGPQSGSVLFPDGRPLLFVVTPSADDAKSLAAVEAIKTVASKMKGQIIFSHLGVSESHENRLLSLIGLEADITEPEIRLIELRKTSDLAPWDHPAVKYRFVGDVTSAADLESFLSSFLKGSLEPYFRSEMVYDAPSPDFRAATPVVSLVGSNFHDFVTSTSKYIFVNFFAPWCGHCRKTEPVWKEVARRLSAIDNIILAKIDASANEVPQFHVETYPTFLLIRGVLGTGEPLSNSNAVEYNGPRSADDFIDWLHQQVVPPFSMDKVLSTEEAEVMSIPSSRSAQQGQAAKSEL